MTHALTRRGFLAASAALAGATAMAHHARAQSAALTLRAATRTLDIGGRAATVYGLVNAAGGQALILDPGQRTAADLAADRQEVVMFRHDFSFKPAEEVLTEVTGGVGHDVAGMGHGAPAASGTVAGMDHGTMVGMTDMPGMRMGLNDFNFDAYLANDRTLSDPDVIRAEKGDRVRLRIINAAAATVFWIDTGAVPGRLVAVDGHDVVPVIGSRFGMAMGQRLDVEIDLPAGIGAFPVLALREGARERAGIILATAGAEVARIEGVAETEAPTFDSGLEQELTLRAVAPLATRPASKTHMMLLGGSMQPYVWTIDGRHGVIMFRSQPPALCGGGARHRLCAADGDGHDCHRRGRGRALDAALPPHAASFHRHDDRIRHHRLSDIDRGACAAPARPTRTRTTEMTLTSFPIKARQILLALTLGAFLAPPVAAQTGADLSTLLRETHVHGLAFDPGNPNRLLIATHHGLNALDPASQTTTLVGISRDDFMGFTTHPTASGPLYASGHPAGGGNLGVITSQDGGLTWSPLSDGVGGPVDFHVMEVSRANPEVLYGVYAGVLQTSRDGGRTWKATGPAPARMIDLATSARDSDTLFAATEAGLLRSADGGVTWVQAHPTTAPVSFVDVGTDGTVLAFVLGVGLLQADEQALDWTVLSDGFGDGYLLHLARDPKVPMRIYAVSGQAEMLLSQDGGATWELVARP